MTVRNAPRFRLLTGLFISLLLVACTKPVDLAPAPPAEPAQYELSAIRYFLSSGDGLDTTTVSLQGYTVQNPGSVVTDQQVANTFSELVKTSQFTVDKPELLPADLALNTLTAPVPAYWNGDTSFTYFAEQFPLASTPQQKPYGDFPRKPMAVQVPPRASLAISRQIDAHQLVCSFEGLVRNTSTGARYPITGKWQGLLRYDNVSVTLTQQPLP